MPNIKINRVIAVAPLCIEYDHDGVSHSEIVYFDYKSQKLHTTNQYLSDNDKKNIIQYWFASKVLPNTTTATLPNIILSQLNNINSETQNKIQEKQNES